MYAAVIHLEQLWIKDAREGVDGFAGGPERGLFPFANLSIGILHISSHTPPPLLPTSLGREKKSGGRGHRGVRQGKGQGYLLTVSISHARF